MKGITFSPLTAVAASDNPLSLQVAPAAGDLIDAVRVKAVQPVGLNDFQWVLFGLSVPLGAEIRGVRVCYLVEAPAAGQTFIAQTRLTHMAEPNTATVFLDDATSQTSIAPACYTSHGDATVHSTITLGLRVVIGNVGEAIRIGGITLVLQ